MNRDTGAHDLGLDALLPPEIARKVEMLGAAKVRMDAMRLGVLAVLAGAFIGLGAMSATTVLAGAENTLPFGVGRLLAGLVFCLGLVLIVVGGAELFTGNTLMVVALAARRITLGEMLKAWAIVYAGNFVGALGTALLVFLSGQHGAGEGAVADAALSLALDKVGLPFGQAVFLGILCNMLVCLALWLAVSGRSTTDKIVAIILPVTAFVAAGFEHSVANMYLIPLALLIKAWSPEALWSLTALQPADLTELTWIAFLENLLPVTLGNLIGGGLLVGTVYWFVYLRPQGKEAPEPG